MSLKRHFRVLKKFTLFDGDYHGMGASFLVIDDDVRSRIFLPGKKFTAIRGGPIFGGGSAWYAIKGTPLSITSDAIDNVLLKRKIVKEIKKGRPKKVRPKSKN